MSKNMHEVRLEMDAVCWDALVNVYAAALPSGPDVSYGWDVLPVATMFAMLGVQREIEATFGEDIKAGTDSKPDGQTGLWRTHLVLETPKQDVAERLRDLDPTPFLAPERHPPHIAVMVRQYPSE